MYKYELGCEAIDTVSGIKGILTSRTQYLNGCVQYGITPKAKKADTEYPDSFNIDEDQLTVKKKRVTVKRKRNGGRQIHQPRKTR